MIEKGKVYRPIEGDATGVVEEIENNVVYWLHKTTMFKIPLERFSEYFCKEEGNVDDGREDREGSPGDTLRQDPH